MISKLKRTEIGEAYLKYVIWSTLPTLDLSNQSKNAFIKFWSFIKKTIANHIWQIFNNNIHPKF